MRRKTYITAGIIAIAIAGVFVLRGIGAVNVSLERSEEIGDVVITRFGPLVGERVAKNSFSIEPEVSGELVWFEEHRELYFIPEKGFDPNTDYVVTISTPRLAAAIGSRQSVFTFSPVRFLPSGRSFTPEYGEGKYVDVNLATMELTLVEDGVVVNTYPVGGKGSPWTSPTREGSFTVQSKSPLHFSSIYRVYMPFAIQYSGNFFIHDWPYWPGGRPLTSTYSGGCVRLFPGDAEEVYNWVEVGTPIIVHSTEGRLPVFSVDNVNDGDMVREEGSDNVYIVKHAGDERYKRHVWTPQFAEWYGHLGPFWDKIKIVADGTLNEYIESRWVIVDTPNMRNYIYELNTEQQTRHLKTCSETPLSGRTRPELCREAWSRYGWPPHELFTISVDEFNAYNNAGTLPLKPAPDITSNNE